MRLIKFRGRDVETGKLVYGDITQAADATDIWDWEDGDTHIVDPESVAQFCGYDREGNEIYEGDTFVDEYGQKYVARLKVIGVQKTEADEDELAENLETGEIVNVKTGEIIKAGGVSNGGA